MSMSREEALLGEDDGRYPRPFRGVSYPGKPNDEWPVHGPILEESLCEVCRKPGATLHVEFDGYACAECQASWTDGADQAR
jgi:hypothetical protein